MITAAAFCPHPLLMFRELGGIADPVADLRAACLAAVASVAGAADEVVVVGGSDAFFSSPSVSNSSIICDIDITSMSWPGDHVR